MTPIYYKMVKPAEFLRVGDIVRKAPKQPENVVDRILIKLPDRLRGQGHNSSGLYPTQDYWWVSQDRLRPVNNLGFKTLDALMKL